MKIQRIAGSFLRFAALSMAAFVCGSSWPVLAGGTNVSIVDFAFNPSAVTINANDTVIWSWAGISVHSSTSDTGLWDSGILSNGAKFTNTFKASGSFPYHCTVHPLTMLASVTVKGTATNAPPTVSITSPANGAVFTAPWTGTIQATASDSDGTVTKIDFLANGALLGTVTNPPPTASFTVSNLAAGTYTLTAAAQDNGGARTTSAGVNISVVAQASPITLSSVQRLHREFGLELCRATKYQSHQLDRPSHEHRFQQSGDFH
jgi:plastocyanin